MAIFGTCLKIAFFCIPVHKDEVPGLCTCDNTRSGPRKTQSNTCLRHQNASEHAYLGSCANVDHARVQGKHHIAPQWYSAVGLGSTSRTRQTHASKRIRPWTHTHAQRVRGGGGWRVCVGGSWMGQHVLPAVLGWCCTWTCATRVRHVCVHVCVP